ncbi:MAG: response regulator transcription factor [Candidatus Melainabacteria bacterium]|nr:response regulator transcription factor [Candidatus Melainabacteria bacterium]
MRILLVEDDEYLKSALALALKHKGYNVDLVGNGLEAIAAVSMVTYDLMLLDLGLPDMDGLKTLEALRSGGNEIPVIVITARDKVPEKILGLNLGANDYLVKPFDFGELEARMRAILRKNTRRNQTELIFGDLSLDTTSGEITLAGESVSLTPKEAAVFNMLVTAGGKVVGKQQLIDKVSDFLDESSENALEIVIHRLRRKLSVSSVKIKTVRGFGYQLTK